MGRDPHSRFLHENEYSVKDVSPVIRGRMSSSGAASGNAARFKALDALIQRRRLAKEQARQERDSARPGTPDMVRQAQASGTSPQKKGVIVRGGSGPRMEDIERMISGKKGGY